MIKMKLRTSLSFNAGPPQGKRVSNYAQTVWILVCSTYMLLWLTYKATLLPTLQHSCSLSPAPPPRAHPQLRLPAWTCTV